MALQTKFAWGCSDGSVARLAGDSQVVWQCGNCLVVKNIAGGRQKLLPGTALGLGAYAANEALGLIAVVQKGAVPKVNIHSTHDLRLLSTLTPEATEGGGISALAFSADGLLLAVCTQEPDRGVAVWNWQQEEVIGAGKQAHAARHVSFCGADSSRLATSAGLGQLSVWTLEQLWNRTEVTERQWPEQEGAVTCHAWHEQHLYCGCADGRLLLLDATTLDVLDSTDVGAAVTAVAANGSCVAVADARNQLQLYLHPAAGASLQGASTNAVVVDGGVLDMAFGGQGGDELLVTSATSRVLTVTITDAAQPITQMKLVADHHSGAVTGLAAHPDGCHVVSCGRDGSLRLWNLQSGNLVAKRAFGGPLTALCGTPRAAVAAVGSSTGVIRLVSLSGKLTVTYRARLFGDAVACLAFNSSCTLLAVATSAGQVCILSLAAPAARVVATAAAPAAVLSMSWCVSPEADEKLLLSLTPGAFMSISGAAIAAAVQAGGSARVQCMTGTSVRVVRTSYPLPCIAGANCALYGVGTDKFIHRYSLPADPGAWQGLPGRPLRSVSKVQAHAKTGTCLALCPSGQLVASGGADGAVAARYSSLAGTESSAEAVLHDLWTGGTALLAFDATGRSLVSAAADGSMFAHVTTGDSHISEAPTVAPADSSAADVDVADSPDEPTVDEVHRQQQEDSARQAAVPAQQAALEQLRQLQQQLLECLEQDRAAPPLERLPPVEFVIDGALQRRLQQEGEARVAALREAARQEDLRLELIAQRLITECRDSMQTTGAAVTGIRSSVEVWNFPLQHQPAEDVRYRKVCALRRLEMREHRATGFVDGGSSFTCAQDDKGTTVSGSAEDADDAHAAASTTAITAGATATVTSASDSAGGSAGGGSAAPARTLYNDYDVTTPGRKTTQLVLYKQHARELKAAFNASLAALGKRKVVDAERVGDLNARIDEVLKELALLGPLPAAEDKVIPKFEPIEDLEATVFTVRDDEVPIGRYLSAEEQERQDAARRAEEERLRRAAEDDAAERALRQMMGGTLQSKSAASAAVVLQRPAWMSGDPKTFTEEQQREVKELAAKEKQLEEDKAKRKTMMETELRTMRATVEEICTKFDEALAALEAQRLATQQELLCAEMRMLLLAADLDECDRLNVEAKRQLAAQLAAARDKQGHVLHELNELRTDANEQQELVTNLNTEERQLDRNLRREFADADHFYPKLSQLYKHRAAAATAGEVLVKPDGLDAALWDKFVTYRGQRVKTELEAAEAALKLERMRRQLELLEAAETAVNAEISGAMSAIANFKQRQQHALYDVDLQFRLKQGQVEAACDTVQPTTSINAVLVDRKLVEGLNAVIQRKNAKRVDTLTQIKDAKKGIYLLEWENAKCNMEAEDIISLTKELQLLHVTKEFQQLVKQGNTKVSSKEATSLENLLRTRETLQAKKVEEKKRRLRQISDEIASKERQNEEVQEHLTGLERILEDQARLTRSVHTVDDQANRRMRSLVTQRKLKDIVEIQRQELEALKAELDRMHTKSFPAFVDRQTILVPEMSTVR